MSHKAPLSPGGTTTFLRADGSYAIPALGSIGNAGVANGYLVASVAGNALTIALKTLAGTDPSASDPVYLAFRDASDASGAVTVLTITAATSFTISAGSTLGTANNTPFRFWIVGFNDGGTFRLGAVNALSGTNIMPLRNWVRFSAADEGGVGTADSAQTIYSNAVVSAKPIRILGWLEYSSGLATAGTYASAPTKVHVQSESDPLPGDQVQAVQSASSAVATGTTTVPLDDTIPQNTEGDEYLSQAITPISAANVLEISHQGRYACSLADTAVLVALFQDTTANALAAGVDALASAGGGRVRGVTLSHRMLAAVAVATTFKVRAGPNSASTLTFNGAAGARQVGGVNNSYLRVVEVCA